MLTLLVHGGTASWRQAMRVALRPMLDTTSNANGVALLVSSREAEAAKCLADPRVGLVVAIDEPGIRRTLSVLAPALPAVWVAEGDVLEASVTRVRVMLERLVRHRQSGSSA